MLPFYIFAGRDRESERQICCLRLLETMTPTSFFEISTSLLRIQAPNTRFANSWRCCPIDLWLGRLGTSGLTIDRPLLIDSDMVCCFLVAVWVRSGPPEIRVWSRSCWGTEMNTLRVELYCKGWLVHLSWRFQIRFCVVVASFSGF